LSEVLNIWHNSIQVGVELEVIVHRDVSQDGLHILYLQIASRSC